MEDYAIINIGVLATPTGKTQQKGDGQENVSLIKNAAVTFTNGKITYVGALKDAPKASEVVDAGGRLVTPGLVDCHTHLVFGGFRQHEFEKKLAGVPYLDILNEGGGILSTVEATRMSSYQELYHKSVGFLNEMLAHGTTTVEIKSGYGLNLETELLQLQVINDLSKSYEVVPTFMGAHAVPKEFKGDRDGYLEYLIEDILPTVAARKLARFCDVFCENSVFSVVDSRKILKAAKGHGLIPKIHADEIVPIGGAELAAEMGAISAEHLLEASDTGLGQMADEGVIAVLLPATSFYLDKGFARARDMVDKGIAVAIATDFNPGSSPNFNMQLVLSLAVLKLKLTPKEALTAATLNSAAAIGLAERKGSLELGKDADIVIWDAPDLNFLFYRYGNNQVFESIKMGWCA